MNKIKKIVDNLINDNYDMIEACEQAYDIARILKMNNALKWLEKQLKGYTISDELPKDRIVLGTLKCKKCFLLHDLSKTIQFYEYKVRCTVYELINMRNQDIVCINFNDVTNQKLNEKFNKKSYKFSLLIEKTLIDKIIENIRTSLLNWALNLHFEISSGDVNSISAVEEKKIRMIDNVYKFDYVDI